MGMNFAQECTSARAHKESGAAAAAWLRNYTFRSMPRTSTSRAQPQLARETSGLRARRPRRQAWTKRLGKRVVQKPDGRYLIYFEKI
jgi:hypothetical protein